MSDRKSYTFIGDDHPPGYRRVGTIDVADPADVRQAQDRGYRIGTIYDGGSYSCAEPCAADIYERPDEEASAVDIDLPLAQAITGYWGERCENSDPNCPCCQAWASYDRANPTKTVTVLATDVCAVMDSGNSITLHFSEIKAAKAFRDSFPATIGSTGTAPSLDKERGE